MFPLGYEIIDFHTHPFLSKESNICYHKDFCDMGVEQTLAKMDSLGVSKICGSVIRLGGCNCQEQVLQRYYKNNNEALKLKELFGDRYIPGYHVHPDFIEESIKEVDRMHSLGINLIGELVPYIDGWSGDYNCKKLFEILDYAKKYDVVVNFHNSGNGNEDAKDELVKAFPTIRFVGAHPYEMPTILRHIERLKNNENYYIDLSGTGLFREGLLRRFINEVGVDRILFGSDFPVCNMAMYVGAVALDNQLSHLEKEKIFSLNAKQLLGIK